MANSSRSPMPFGPKNVSTMTAPPMSADICRATLVISERIDIRSAWTHSTRRGEIPLARAMLMESLCRVRIMSARSRRLHTAPSPSPSTSAGMKKFLKCSTGLSHGATYLERADAGEEVEAADDEEQQQHGDDQRRRRDARRTS